MSSELHIIFWDPWGQVLCCIFLSLSSFWHRIELKILYEIDEYEWKIWENKRSSNIENFETWIMEGTTSYIQDWLGWLWRVVLNWDLIISPSSLDLR